MIIDWRSSRSSSSSSVVGRNKSHLAGHADQDGLRYVKVKEDEEFVTEFLSCI